MKKAHNIKYYELALNAKEKRTSNIGVRVLTSMVPKVRIELTADPYQGSVLPLNYIGI